MPKISVIIPSYNCEEFIIQALESVLNQSFQDFEIIVVDDGSTDNTQEALDSLITKHPDKIRYYYQKNQGVSSARNKGIEEARGEYIAFLDSDDLWKSAYLEKMVKKLDEEYDWVVCDNLKRNIDMYTGDIDEFIEPRMIDVAWDMERVLRESLIRDRIGSPGKIMIRKKIIKKNQILFDTRLHSREDWDFCLKILSCGGKLGIVREPLTVYQIRNNNSNSTRKMKWAWLDYTYILLESWKDSYWRLGIKNSYANHMWDLSRKYFYFTAHKGKSLRCAINSILASSQPMLNFVVNITRGKTNLFSFKGKQ